MVPLSFFMLPHSTAGSGTKFSVMTSLAIEIHQNAFRSSVWYINEESGEKELKNCWGLWPDFTFLTHCSLLHIDTKSLLEKHL